MTIGEKISENRKSANLTQKELGELTGIDGATIGKYERGVLNPKVETIKKIATALNVPWYELYEGDENGDDLKMVFGDLDEEIKNPNYKQRLDSAAAYLVELQQDAEYKSGIEWTGEEGNNWMKRRISDAAKRFNVDEAALSDTVNFNFPEEERWLGELHEIVNEFNYHHAGRISFKCLEKVCRAFIKMSNEGQTKAAERVQELTEIPRYQLAPDAAQTAPDDAASKEPDKK